MISQIRINSITKVFPGGIVANEKATCVFKAGEIHAVLGANGAGKTTLMRILAGFYSPDIGDIEIDGVRTTFANPSMARVAGIAMVHQHFSLIPALSVAENLAIGSKSAPEFLNPKVWNEKLMRKAKEYGIEIRPDVRVSDLSMGERQRVEILRLLVEDAQVLILDEPTSILAPIEAEWLFDHLRRFADSGLIVIFVTHKIKHVKAYADRATILRNGKTIATVDPRQVDEQELTSLIIGRADARTTTKRSSRAILSKNNVFVEACNLTVSPIYSPIGLSNVSFELHSGEILGVAGISGNGQDELVAALSGTVRYKGSITFAEGTSRIDGRSGLGYIPGDRRGVGVAVSLTVGENLNLHNYRKRTFRYGPFLKRAMLNSEASRLIQAYGIHPSNPDMKVGTLSGGNIQKVVLARELAGQPSVILAVTPTAGLDISTVDFVHKEIIRQADAGAAVLYVSEDIDELVELCDRILVLFGGKAAGMFEPSSLWRSQIGLAMSGASQTNERAQSLAGANEYAVA